MNELLAVLEKLWCVSNLDLVKVSINDLFCLIDQTGYALNVERNNLPNKDFEKYGMHSIVCQSPFHEHHQNTTFGQCLTETVF